jgi:hypothetical protein
MFIEPYCVSPGVNPFATITAFAERSVDLVTKRIGSTVDMSPNGKLDLFGKPSKSFALSPDMVAASETIRSAGSSKGGIRFMEIMDGHIHIGDDITDFVVAENVAKGASSSARFYLNVDAYSVKNRKFFAPLKRRDLSVCSYRAR